MVLARRDISEQIFDEGVHLADRDEDSLRELLLVVHGEPAVEHLHDLGLQHLGHGELRERLPRQDLKVLKILGALSELLAVLCAVRHLAEHILGVGHILYVSRDVVGGGQGNLSGVLLEAFHALEVDDELDHVEALQDATV